MHFETTVKLVFQYLTQKQVHSEDMHQLLVTQIAPEIKATFWMYMPARGPVLEFLRCERPVPHVEVCDHATGSGAVQVVRIVAPQQVDLQEEGEGNLEVFEVFVHVVDVQEVSILKRGIIWLRLLLVR